MGTQTRQSEGSEATECPNHASGLELSSGCTSTEHSTATVWAVGLPHPSSSHTSKRRATPDLTSPPGVWRVVKRRGPLATAAGIPASFLPLSCALGATGLPCGEDGSRCWACGPQPLSARAISPCTDYQQHASSAVHEDELKAWLAAEAPFTPKNILATQPEITSLIREKLLLWVFEAVCTYRMNQETFMLTINHLDRYLDTEPGVKEVELRLLGAACLWSASKYEEVNPPSAKQVLLWAGTGTVKQLVRQEAKLLDVLQWRMSPPSSLKLLHAFSHLAQINSRTVQALAECMLLLASHDVQYCAVARPSQVAAAALCAALLALDAAAALPTVLGVSCCTDQRLLGQLTQRLHHAFKTSYDRKPRCCRYVSTFIRCQAEIWRASPPSRPSSAAGAGAPVTPVTPQGSCAAPAECEVTEACLAVVKVMAAPSKAAMPCPAPVGRRTLRSASHALALINQPVPSGTKLQL